MRLTLTKLSKFEQLIIVTTLVIWVLATVIVAELVIYAYQSGPKILAQVTTPAPSATPILTPTETPTPSVTFTSTPTETPAPPTTLTPTPTETLTATALSTSTPTEAPIPTPTPQDISAPVPPIDTPTQVDISIPEVKIMKAERYDKPEGDRSGILLYKGPVLKVIQTESEIAVENVSSHPVAIRISWDGKDPHGRGDGGDSFIDNWVEPNEWISQKFRKHFSVQIWAWGSSTALVDSCNLSIPK